eukprot:4820653-Pleurochrysis_carterae.AAC.3
MLRTCDARAARSRREDAHARAATLHCKISLLSASAPARAKAKSTGTRTRCSMRARPYCPAL